MQHKYTVNDRVAVHLAGVVESVWPDGSYTVRFTEPHSFHGEAFDLCGAELTPTTGYAVQVWDGALMAWRIWDGPVPDTCGPDLQLVLDAALRVRAQHLYTPVRVVNLATGTEVWHAERPERPRWPVAPPADTGPDGVLHASGGTQGQQEGTPVTDAAPPGFTTYYNYLRVLRATNNISYIELAAELAVPPGDVAACEAGLMPTDLVMRAIAGVEAIERRRHLTAHEQRERLVALAAALRPGDAATVHAISHARAAAVRELVAQLSNPALPDDRFNLAVQVASAIITGTPIEVPKPKEEKPSAVAEARKYYVQYDYSCLGWSDDFTGSSSDANGFESLVAAEAARTHELLSCMRVGIEASDNAKDPACYRIVLRTDEVVA